MRPVSPTLKLLILLARARVSQGMQTSVERVQCVIIDPALALGEFAPDSAQPPASAPRDTTRRGGP